MFTNLRMMMSQGIKIDRRPLYQRPLLRKIAEVENHVVYQKIHTFRSPQAEARYQRWMLAVREDMTAAGTWPDPDKNVPWVGRDMVEFFGRIQREFWRDHPSLPGPDTDIRIHYRTLFDTLGVLARIHRLCRLCGLDQRAFRMDPWNTLLTAKLTHIRSYDRTEKTERVEIRPFMEKPHD